MVEFEISLGFGRITWKVVFEKIARKETSLRSAQTSVKVIIKLDYVLLYSESAMSLD